jgi:hypothetical protein
MIVVADTGPLNYLVLIEAVDVLQPLYKHVVVPKTVAEELRSAGDRSTGGCPDVDCAAARMARSTPGPASRPCPPLPRSGGICRLVAG